MVGQLVCKPGIVRGPDSQVHSNTFQLTLWKNSTKYLCIIHPFQEWSGILLVIWWKKKTSMSLSKVTGLYLESQGLSMGPLLQKASECHSQPLLVTEYKALFPICKGNNSRWPLNFQIWLHGFFENLNLTVELNENKKQTKIIINPFPSLPPGSISHVSSPMSYKHKKEGIPHLAPTSGSTVVMAGKGHPSTSGRSEGMQDSSVFGSWERNISSE